MCGEFPRATTHTETLLIRIGALATFFELIHTQRNQVMDSSELSLESLTGAPRGGTPCHSAIPPAPKKILDLTRGDTPSRQLGFVVPKCSTVLSAKNMVKSVA